MANDHEKIEDILAEWRDCVNSADPSIWNDERIAGLVRNTKKDTLAYLDRMDAAVKRAKTKASELSETMEKTLEIFKRIEAASDSLVKPKRTPVGNAAALREALIGLAQAVQDFMATKGRNFYPDMAIALDAANAALSAPPRNCDVGTAEEWDNRMDVYCQKCESCPLWDNANNGVRCEFTWAQMPYAEEGDDK